MVEIRPSPRWRAIDFAELWRYRELAFFLAWRDIKVRYKQTVLGIAWALLQPLMTMLVFVVIRSLAGLEPTGTAPGPVLVFAAVLPWQFFQTSVSQSGQSLVGASNLISKVYFPRLIVPLAALGPALVDFAISLGLMAALMLWYGVPVTPGVLLLPPLTVGLIVAAFGFGTGLAGLTVAYRDFRYVIPFFLQMGMLLSPVGYELDRVAAKMPEGWFWVYFLNPMAGLIGAFRGALLGEPIPWGGLAISMSVAAAMLVAGSYYFRSVEKRFADIV